MALFAAYAPAALGFIASALARIIMTETTRSLLRSRAQKKAYRLALRRALTQAGKEFPDLVGSFLSKSTLRAIDTELRLFLARDRTPSTQGIINAYEQASGAKADPRLSAVAERFLALFDEESKKESALQEHLTHRQVDEISRSMRDLTGGGGLPLRSDAALSSIAEIRDAFASASHELLDWPQTIDGKQWIDRPEFDVLVDRITSTTESVSLLLGVPGAGKSALLAKVGSECAGKGWAVLAIKADQLSEEVANLEGLRTFYDLPAGVPDCLRSAAKTTKVVLLIDQLDALSELIDLRTQRLRVLLRLINVVKHTENVHVVCSSRTFERQYDQRLNSIQADDVNLSLPPWTAIAQILAERGVVAESWPEGFREMLRVPQYLKLFLRHFSGPGEAQVFESYQIMLEQLWNEHLFKSGDRARASGLLQEIATEMAEQEVLFVPSAKYDRDRDSITYLVSAGVLQYDHAGRQVSFTHQTLFDFSRARAFVSHEQSLTRYVLERQTGLFIRPKLWSALNYLRGANSRAYLTEVTAIWNAENLRPHVRMLLIDFVGQQDQPLDFEVRLLRPMLGDANYVAKALTAIAGRERWFNAIVDQELPELMRASTELAWPTQGVLGGAWPFARDKVLELIKLIWAPDSGKHVHAWYTLRNLDHWDSDGLDIAVMLVEDGSMANGAVQDLASIISVARPDLAPRLIGAQLRKQLKAARLSREPKPTFDDSNQDAWLQRMNYNNKDPLRNIVESGSTEWYEVSAIAEAAPAAYLQHVWPPVREIIEEISAEHPSNMTEYGNDHLLATHFEVNKGEGREHPFMDAFVVAVRACAKQESAYFLDFVRANESSVAMTVHRLLALGLCEIAEQETAFGIEYLLGDVRRLSLENFHEDERETKMLIRALVPHLSAGDVRKLEDAILRTDPYRDRVSGLEPKERMKFQRYVREFRLRLLLQIPPDRLTPATRALIESELHIFPNFRDEHREITSWTSSSPMSAATMERASDEAIENFLKAYPDSMGWGSGFKRDGGSIEVSRAFAQFAKGQPGRALAIIDTLDPETHHRPAAYAIRDLEEKDLADDDLFDLVIRLDARGFASEEFRDSAASALRKRVKQRRGLPDSIISLLERWLDEFLIDPVPESNTEAKDEDDGTDIEKERSDSKGDDPSRLQRSILWGGGGVRTIPSGGSFLNAYAYGLLARNPIPSERLLGKLGEFVERGNRVEIWRALCFDALTQLRYCDREFAQHFLRRLYSAYPKLLACEGGIFVLAYALHWADPELTKAWMLEVRARKEWALGRCAYGELLILRAFVVKADQWASSELERLLAEHPSASTEDCEMMLGVMHGATHLWKDAEDRLLLTRILATGMNSAGEGVAAAAMDWFRLLDELKLTNDTRPIIEALASGRALDFARRQSFTLDRLDDIVDEAPELVYRVAHRLIQLYKTSLSNLATSIPLESEALLGIALTLQRLEEPHRTHGLELFELLLLYNAYKVHDVLMDIDRRPGASRPIANVRRRRRQRSKPRQHGT